MSIVKNLAGSVLSVAALGIGLACPPVGLAMLGAGAITANDSHNRRRKAEEAAAPVPAPAPVPREPTIAELQEAVTRAKLTKQLKDYSQ